MSYVLFDKAPNVPPTLQPVPLAIELGMILRHERRRRARVGERSGVTMGRTCYGGWCERTQELAPDGRRPRHVRAIWVLQGRYPIWLVVHLGHSPELRQALMSL